MMNPDVVESRLPVKGLEARYFTDKNLFEKIIESVFYKNWLLACHSSQFL